jgi:hypothetical protein
MNTYFAFSDEYGCYQKLRTENFNRKHPHYIRANYIIKDEPYSMIEKSAAELKKKYGFPENGEIKWAYIGDIYNKRFPSGFEGISLEQIKSFIEEFLKLAFTQTDAYCFFTVTNNRDATKTEEATLITWHIQNALQRFQIDLGHNDGYGVIILDDLNANSEKINKNCYRQMCSGDFVKYENIKKSILIDYSHQCVGLQIADIIAGVFASSLLKHGKETNGYDFAWKLFNEILIDTIRDSAKARSAYSNPYFTKGYGVVNVPNNNGLDAVKSISDYIENKKTEWLWE